MDFSHEVYIKNEFDFSALKHLDSIGLISFDPISGYRRMGKSKCAAFYYYGEPTLMEFQTDENQLSVGKVVTDKHWPGVIFFIRLEGK
jgi:hypothetical protein